MSQSVGGGPLLPALVALPPTTKAHADRARRQAVRRSLRASIKDGIAWSVMHGAGERYVAPFVILGGSSLWKLAAITTLPALGGALVQRIAVGVTDASGKRKPFFVIGSSIQALLWLIFVVAVLMPQKTGYWMMLGGYLLFLTAHNFAVPAWFSTMGDLVPASRRGRYFGLRNFLTGIALIVAFVLAGAWLTFCEGLGEIKLLGLAGRDFGFLTLFLVAGVGRGVSVYYLNCMVEPPYHAPVEDRFTFRQFLRRMLVGQYGRYVIYRAALFAGQMLIMTYLNWYLLDQLAFSPFVYAWIVTAGLGSLYVAQPMWGPLCDRWGARRVLGIGGLGMILTPMLLLVSANAWYLGAVELYDGVMLAAVNIAANNYILDIVTPSKRARCNAYASVFNALGGVVGAFGGAPLAVWGAAMLPWTLGPVTVSHPFTLILLLAIVMLALPNIILLPTFHEVRLGRPRAVVR